MQITDHYRRTSGLAKFDNWLSWLLTPHFRGVLGVLNLDPMAKPEDPEVRHGNIPTLENAYE